jgi:hypothetical protein
MLKTVAIATALVVASAAAYAAEINFPNRGRVHLEYNSTPENGYHNGWNKRAIYGMGGYRYSPRMTPSQFVDELDERGYRIVPKR